MRPPTDACQNPAACVIERIRLPARAAGDREDGVTEREAFIALNRVSGLGAVTVKRLLEAFGSAAALAGRGPRELRAVPGIGPEKAEAFGRDFAALRWEDELERAADRNVTVVTWADAAYPAQLKEIADPPLALYVTGDTAALAGPAVALIGTRHPTVYGRETARRLGFQLAGAGYVVVSGLALGIDTEAHRGAVQARGRTVAVVGGALDCLYPRENEPLAGEMAGLGGAVVSEYPFGRQPDRQTFPMRNRVVSGLCKGVVVVEAPLTSGTMITVDQALDQGRTVMAVPGRVDSPASQGCHRLLRAGARLVTHADEIAEELQELLPRPSGRPAAADGGANGALEPVAPESPDERRLLAAIGADGEAETPVDDVIRASGLPAGLVNALLVGLQIKRRVKLLPGGRVKRILL
jgi:DNA processing protein